MRKIALVTMAAAFAVASFTGPTYSEVLSLRGASSPDAAATMFDKKKQKTMKGGFERAWKTQPPAIPHSIDKDRITLRDNSCLSCHSAANFKKEKAPKVGDSHFIAADGTKLQDISKRRYFCNQCHVPQVDAKPLVENVFEGAKK